MKHSIGKFNASCGGFQWKVLFWSLYHNSDNPNFPKSASMVDCHPGVISKLSTSGKPFDLSVVHFIPCIGILLVRLFEIVRVRLLRLHLQTLFFRNDRLVFSLQGLNRNSPTCRGVFHQKDCRFCCRCRNPNGTKLPTSFWYQLLLYPSFSVMQKIEVWLRNVSAGTIRSVNPFLRRLVWFF